MRTGAGPWVRAELRRRQRGLFALSVLCALVVTVVHTSLISGAIPATHAAQTRPRTTQGRWVPVALIAGSRR
jgi:hypothetical protein